MDDTRVKDVFAKQIVRLRKNRNLTQGELADLLEVGVSTVSDWETGKKLPRSGAIEKLASTFKVSKSSLFEEEDEHKSPIPSVNEKGLVENEINIEDLIHKKLVYQGHVLNDDEKSKFIKMLRALLD